MIYYARESWFIKMTAVKDDLVRNNGLINWIPESIGKGRFGDWLENIQDWGIFQKPLLGTPLPVCSANADISHCIGSREELKKMSPNYAEVVKEIQRRDGWNEERGGAAPAVYRRCDHHLSGVRKADAPGSYTYIY